MCNTTAKGVTQAMADGDVIVPDIKPDILKLIEVNSDACITDKYIENGRLVICGRVNYKVLYVPDSEHEKIKSISASMEFRQVVDGGGADPDCRIMLRPTVERVEFSAVNSRKLRLRAIVHIEYEISRLCDMEISGDIDDENFEKLCDTVSYEDTVDISEHDFTVRETIEIPNGAESVCEILKTDVRIYDTEYKPVTGKVIVKGNLGICVLYTDTDCEVRFVEAELPFTEVLDADGVNEDTLCDIDYCVLGVMSGCEPDTDGDMRHITLDIDMCASLKCTQSHRSPLLCDCYMPHMHTNCESEELSICVTKERPQMQSTIREIIELGENAPELKKVYNVMTNAVITKSELSKKKIICEGKVEAYILYLTDTAESPVYSHKKDIPFSYMIECENDTDGLMCEIKAGVKHVSYNLNSGGEVEVRCVLCIDCMLIKDEKINNISKVSVNEREDNRGIVIYFAREGERVWDIAKRYSVPVNSLNAHNEMDTDKIDKDRKLFIPNR